jgi:hypothetical protein
MGHEEHHHEEKPLSFFASPLLEPSHAHASHENHDSNNHTYASAHGSDIEEGKPKAVDPNHVPFENSDCALHDNPAFHRHAEATTSELFYDLFFVANLTTFTSNLEINDRNSLTAYIGFFALLWLTWYQVSLYDVRFSADSVFERIAKGIHFGVMVRPLLQPERYTAHNDIGRFCSHWTPVEAWSGGRRLQDLQSFRPHPHGVAYHFVPPIFYYFDVL